MFERAASEHLLSLSKSYGLVCVMGPRQSGKTTLVQHVFPSKPYANLENPDDRLLAKTDPRAFLSQYPEGAILDEIQRVPELLSYLQVIVDKRKEPGLFVLTGSHQLELHEAISQSLAGRVGVVILLPLSLGEVQSEGVDFKLDEALYHGFYPGVFSNASGPTQVYRNYVKTYLERDVRRLSNIKDLVSFQRFMKLCAGRVGQLLEYSSLANDLGVSSHTVKHWLSVLEASYIIFRLPPYFENVGKRLIKSPKLYFTDVGLAAYLLDIETPAQIGRDPLRGALFENLVVLEFLKYRYNMAKESNLYFYRDSRGNEVDILMKEGRELIPIEIKSGMTFQNEFLKGLRYVQKLAPNTFRPGFLVYAGEQTQEVSGNKLLNYKSISHILKNAQY